MDTNQITEIIGENEVADLLGISVSAASFSTGEYTNSLGQTKVGPSVTLVLLDTESNLRVGEGSAVTLGDYTWHVTKVTVSPTVESAAGLHSSSRVVLVTEKTKQTQPLGQSDIPVNPSGPETVNSSSTFGLGLMAYNFSIVIALALIGYIYGYAFDDFSETELLQATLFWYLPLVFGIYGRTATKIKQSMDRGVSLQKQLATTSLIVRFTGPLGLAFFFPFFFVSKGSALKVAVVGTVVWLVLLEIFFVGIWPSL